jgi:adenylate kinase
MVASALDEVPDGFILDGFPRTVAQAASLDRELQDRRIGLDAVLAFDVDTDVVIQRLSARRICPSCQRGYNMGSAPPRSDETCDVDETPLTQREDDRPETVRHRLAVYEASTAPVRGYYEQHGLVRSVDADAPTDVVFQRAIDAVESVPSGAPGGAVRHP